MKPYDLNTFQRAIHRFRKYSKKKYPWLVYTNLFKSVVAYLIASLFLFIPAFRTALSTDLAYLVLLPVSILWNDNTKSVGAMIQSTVFFICSITSCTLLSYILLFYVLKCSMVLVLLFYMMAIGLLAYLKAKYEKTATVAANVGISLLTIQLTNAHYDFSVTGTLSLDRLLSYYKVTLAGAFISFICNIFIFPTWAAEELHEGLIKGLKNIKSLLFLVTQSIVEYQSDISLNENDSFLSKSYLALTLEERQLKQKELNEGIEKCRKDFTKISNALKESKLEISYFYFDLDFYIHLTSLIKRMLRQLSIVGTACQLLLSVDDQYSPPFNAFDPDRQKVISDIINKIIQPLHELSSVCKYEIQQILRLLKPEIKPDPTTFNMDIENQNSTDVLYDYRSQRAPLLNVNNSTNNTHSYEQFASKIHEIDSCSGNIKSFSDDGSIIVKSIERFNEHMSNFASSLMGLSLYPNPLGSGDSFEPFQLSDASPSNPSSKPLPFLDEAIFIYSYNLGMTQFASTLSMWKNLSLVAEKKKRLYFPLWNRVKNWWSGGKNDYIDVDETFSDPYYSSKPNPDLTEKPKEVTNSSSTLEKPTTIAYNQVSGTLSRVLVALVGWIFSLRSLKPLQYAMRLSLVITFWTLFGIFDDTKDIFHQWRGNWAVVTVAVVMTPTIGSSFSLGFYRVLGSLFGGVWACITWSLYHDYLPSVFSLIFCTLCFAVPCLSIRQHPKMRRLGTVSLMAFTVVLFGAYTLYLTSTEDDASKGPSPFSISELGDILSSSDKDRATFNAVFILAFKRCTMIACGVFLSIISSVLLFPSFARTALRIDMSYLIHEMGYMFSKLTTLTKTIHDAPITSTNPWLDEGTATNVKEHDLFNHETIASFWVPFEFYLHSMLSTCENWLALSEPEWKILNVKDSHKRRAFSGFHHKRFKPHGIEILRKEMTPQICYKRMLELWQRILNRFFMIRLLIFHMRKFVTTNGANDPVVNTSSENYTCSSYPTFQPLLKDDVYEDLLYHIVLEFYYLSSTLYSKVPLSPLPLNLPRRRQKWMEHFYQTEIQRNALGFNGDIWIKLAITGIVGDLADLEQLEATLYGRIDYSDP